ncbi:hypothetical protein [Streptomyces griseoruber]|uniref:hypothetical protein n=1 Tax=Streptomyces griseoruber TaxID=1943 RepID=UPI00138F02C0|nr:hypothetical protein [Streptomyces griseoruber]
MLRGLLTCNTLPNLFCNHPSYTIVADRALKRDKVTVRVNGIDKRVKPIRP